MSSVLLSISGHDRPDIVRDVAEAMLHLNANIEDSPGHLSSDSAQLHSYQFRAGKHYG